MGLSQEALAELLNTTQKQISRYENGQGNPSADVLVKMARTLGVTIDYLVGLADTPDGRMTLDSLAPDERKAVEEIRTGKSPESILAIWWRRWRERTGQAGQSDNPTPANLGEEG
jgi:transcriptional regulator with XRE-family HTH domain